MKKIDFYSRIAIVLVLALLGSEFLVRQVFLGYSPRVRPDLADVVVEKSLALINLDNYRNLFRRNSTQNIASRPQVSSFDPAEFQARLGKPVVIPQTIMDEVKALPRIQIAKGVYAQESEKMTLTTINYDEIEWETITYTTKSGNSYRFRVPKQ